MQMGVRYFLPGDGSIRQKQIRPFAPQLSLANGAIDILGDAEGYFLEDQTPRLLEAVGDASLRSGNSELKIRKDGSFHLFISKPIRHRDRRAKFLPM